MRIDQETRQLLAKIQLHQIDAGETPRTFGDIIKAALVAEESKYRPGKKR